MADEGYRLYDYDVRISLRRQTTQFASTRLTHIESTEERAFENDEDARSYLVELVTEQLNKALDIARERFTFEHNVRLIEQGGDVIDAD